MRECNMISLSYEWAMEKQYIAILQMVCVTYSSDTPNLMNLIKLHSRRKLVHSRKLLQYILFPLTVMYINI